MRPTGLRKSYEDSCVTDKEADPRPPLMPKPQLNLPHSPPRSDRGAAQHKPVPKPHLQNQTLSGPDSSVNESGPTSTALNPTGVTSSPQQEESPCDLTDPEDNKQHTEHDITCNQECKRVPPKLPVPLSVPCEPCHSARVKGNVTSSAENPIRAVMASQTQSKNQYGKSDILDNVCNELRWILSCETQDNPEIRKPSSVKDMVKLWCFPFQNQTKAEKDQALAMSPPTGLDIKTRNTFFRQSKRKTGSFQRKLLEGLWQHRSAVKETGILQQLTAEKLNLQESMYEVLTSEQSYFEKLTVAVDHFQESPDLNSAITSQDRKAIFSNIAEIRKFSQNFLDSMVKKLDSSVVCDGICDAVHHYASGSLGDYVRYISNMEYQKETLQNLRRENPEAVEVLTKLEKDPCCGRLPLESFLFLPFHRIFHLKLLMETVQKAAAPDSDVKASADKSLTEICKVLDMCTREVDMMKQMEQLVGIANKTDFECKGVPLVSSSRLLVRRGDVTQVFPSESAFAQKKHCPLHLILFNDLLLVGTKKKGSDRYVVHKPVHRSLIEVREGASVQENLEGHDVNRIFLLEVLEDNHGDTSRVLLQTSSKEERDGWLEVFRREEEVFEESDCPQVVCIKPYHGLQPGELSLQLGEMVNIIQKIPNGRMKGRRLSDGERGCFPDEYVIEILNEHVRRRHLRQLSRALKKPCGLILDPPTSTCFK